jgi:hypothetical protein
MVDWPVTRTLSNDDYYNGHHRTQIIFFPSPKSEYFFQQHWESEYLFRKNKNPPFKLNGRSLIMSTKIAHTKI